MALAFPFAAPPGICPKGIQAINQHDYIALPRSLVAGQVQWVQAQARRLRRLQKLALGSCPAPSALGLPHEQEQVAQPELLSLA